MAAPVQQPQRWDRICDLYSRARILPRGKWPHFLNEECSGDVELQQEIEALLQLETPPPEFLEHLRSRFSTLKTEPLLPERTGCDVGDVLSGRFEILRFLGAGGMGEVYEARDRELHEGVAVKVLRAGMAEEVFSDRFRRELRLARRVTDPHVCRVFDFSRHDRPDGTALHYYVMELLGGETLAARLRQSGPVEPVLAREIARQMALGLSAAHEAGIVHRDFKPGNVMLSESAGGLRIVVTDFGLAVPFDSSLTATSLGSTGLVLGTPGYLAPEQLYSGPITPATDVYAYGIVLHELVTGVHPRSPEAHSASFPAGWKTVIEQATAFDPQKRFRNVRETWNALSRSSPSWRDFVRSRRNVLALGGGAAVALGLSLFPTISRIVHQNAGLPAGALIIVTPAINATGESKFDGLTPALQASLAQSAHLNLWPFSRLGDALRRMRLDPGVKPDARQWREIAFREGAPLLVFSTLSRLGAGYVLSIRCEQIEASPAQPVRSWDHSFSSISPGGLFDATHEAATWIRQTAGEDASHLAAYNHLPQDITSMSWEALELFNNAQSLDASGKTPEAIPLLRRAVELDPQFAMGFMRLGDMLNTQRQSDEGFGYWRRAIELARSEHLSEHERLNIESRYSIEIGDFARAEPVLREWARQFPNDRLSAQLLASCLLDLGRYPEGLQIALQDESRSGPSTFGVGVAVRGYAALNRAQDMERQIAIWEKVSPAIWILQWRGVAAGMRGDYASAETFFRRLISGAGGNEVSRGTGLLAVLLADRGDFEPAAQVLRDGISRDREAGEFGFASRKAAALAFLEGVNGRPAMAKAWSREAVSISPSPPVLILAAGTLARHHDLAGAREIRTRFPQGPGARLEAGRLRIEGEIAAAEGNPRRALDLLQKAANLESALQAKEYLAHALELSGEPERASLIYSRIVSTPYLIWDSWESQWPGLGFLAKKHLKNTKA